MIKNNEKINRSVRRTQRDLRNSLIELMKKKSILRITAKEIYEAADIGRTTFYAHYKDQYDLLEEIETDTIEQVEGYLHRNATAILNKKDIIENAIISLNYIADNCGLFQVLLGENGNIIFQKKFFLHFIERSQKVLQNKSENPEDVYIHEGYSVYIVNGTIGLIQYWLKNNMHIPIPVLAKMIIKIIEKIKS